MNKAYNKITWQNKPSTATPLNQTNLNEMSNALDTIDDRVIALDSGKVSSVTVTNTLPDGDVIATITVDGTATNIKSAQVVVDAEPSATSENPLQNKAIYEMLNNLLPEETAEGNPIAISDASGLNAKACSVDLLPIQDLHGYDSPWVGGAGKNKFDLSNPTYQNKTIDTNGELTNSSYYDTWEFVGGETYTLNMVKGSGFDTLRYALFVNGTGTRYTTSTLPLVINATDASIVRITLGKTNFATNVQLEKGSTATDFAPYSNICPISGRVSVELVRCGKNLFDTSNITYPNKTLASDGSLTDTSYYDTYEIKLPNVNSVSFSIVKGTGFDTMRYSLIKNGVVQARQAFTTVPYAITTDGAEAILMTLGKTNFGTDIQLEQGSTATAYEPYQGLTVIVQLGQTVYRATLDVTNGKLTIDSAKETVTAVTRNNNTSFYYVPISAPDRVFNHIISDKMKTSASYGAKGVFLNSSGAVIFATEDEYSTASAMISAFGGSIDICFTLATPIEVTLTAEQISLLNGNNVLVSDSNGDIKLTYSADIGLYIAGQLQS